MNYEKKYKEALERAKLSRLQLLDIGEEATEIEYIFPELKESEDERIRAAIIHFISHTPTVPKGIIDKETMLAWLEKQSEPEDKGEISDGYHTFNELYYYRLLYNAAFFNLLPKEWVHKSKKHNDGEECFGGGWFIVMANLPTGQISNHYELKDWDLFQIPEKEIAEQWDGHTPQEAADRLHRFLLEKQGEQKPTCVLDIEIPFGAKDSELQEATYYIPQGFHAEIEGDRVVIKQGEQKSYGQRQECLDCQFNYAGECKGSCAMKRAEQKPANKVEPKFKVGDWIKNNKTNFIFHITKVTDSTLSFENLDGYSHSLSIESVGEKYHLWTIQDAKDGDVLVDEDNNIGLYLEEKDDLYWHSYIYLGCDGYLRSGVGYHKHKNTKPAIKEQRDLLFQKIKEAGYEWDADKKELKKVSQRMISAEAKEALYDKPEWSEEDETGLTNTIIMLKEGASFHFNKKDITKAVDWLKSLKQRIGG